jgi:hypothetical protein
MTQKARERFDPPFTQILKNEVVAHSPKNQFFFRKKGERLYMRIVYQNALKRCNTHCVDKTLNSNKHNKKEYDLLT